MKHKNEFSLDEFQSYRFKPVALYRFSPNLGEKQSDMSLSSCAKAKGFHKTPFCFLHSTAPLRIDRAVELVWLAACLSVFCLRHTKHTFAKRPFTFI
jgi:hypothetical protein